ncbi:MAG: hypothetical protein EBX46_06225, partial [Burkholderiaceae bacterium]|nr:hypothetical protein [Burkholderiaceae bacterium]
MSNIKTEKRLNERSRKVTEGVARAPNRSMYYAMGYKESDFGKPMVGVAKIRFFVTHCVIHGAIG